MARIAMALLLALVLVPAAWRHLPAPVPHGCVAEGRGEAPRRWLGCSADGGPPRDLSGDERLVLGLPLDLNRATALELSYVPGLTRGLARAIVEDRARSGPFPSVEALQRVHGIGPRRLAAARPSLVVSGVRLGVAEAGE